jgi:acyl carrier protein
VSPPSELLPADDAALRETLKRCSPATYYAACKFRALGRAEDLQLVILGVIARFVERELRPKLSGACETLRLREDLAIDSLTMMEIVMIAEDVLRISVANDELAHLRTIGDVQQFIAEKLSVPAVHVRDPAGRRVNWEPAPAAADLRSLEAAATAKLMNNSAS